VASNEIQAAFDAKMKESGISKRDAVALKLRTFPKVKALTLHPSLEERAGILIPYFTVDGKVRDDIFRVRYLEDPSGGFIPKKPAKYGQPAGSPVAAYFPPDGLMMTYIKTPWSRILKNVNEPLYITEGEFKAASGVIHGFPTIGLGGVYSFQQSKRGIDFLPELEEVEWKERRVYVVYDSDIVSKPEVQQALNVLCAKLTERGAVPKVVRLPSSVYGSAKKYGLDDFLVERGAKAFKALVESAEEYGPARELYELNERFAFVPKFGTAIDFQPKDRRDPYQIVPIILLVNGQYIIGSVIEGKKVTPLTKAWLMWPHRREIAGVDYAPGEQSFIDEDYYNTWRGWGCQSEQGDVKPILALVERLIPQKDRRMWFLKWLAYPLQHPGTKLLSASVLWGLEPGTGKSFIGYVMGDIYGQNFIEIGTDELHSKFNTWARSKQFAMVDEAVETRTSIRETSSALKKLITQEKIQINEKYRPQYELRDTINYYFTSNQPHCLQLDDGDRRYFIHRVESKPLTKVEAAELDKWRKDGGALAFFWYLLHNVKIDDFDPNGHAFQTDDKVEMIDAAKGYQDTFIKELMAEGPSPKWGDLYDVSDLQQEYERRYPTQKAPEGAALSRALRQAGAVHCPGAVVRMKDHPTKVTAALWAVHNPANWKKERSGAVWTKHYAESLARSGRVAAPANF